MKIPEKKIIPLIKIALREDIGSGDITSKLILPRKKKIRARISAKQAGIVCGLDVARLVFKVIDKNIRFKSLVTDGKRVKKDSLLARLEGRPLSILKAERVALNFLGHLSGIATATFKYVQKVRPYRIKIMDTRKTVPGLRILEKYAVGCGGGINHRMGLWDQVLVKDNHIRVHRSSLDYAREEQFSVQRLKKLIEKIKKKKPKGMKTEVEVKNLWEFKEVLLAKPDIIMLDNFSLKNIKKAVKARSEILRSRYKTVELEVSGGVDLDNVCRIAATGVERISIGELTHSAAALDIALDCE